MRGPSGPRLNRATPALGPEHMQTYRIVRPAATHWRKATCAEIDCTAYLNGWRTEIDEHTQLGQRQAAYIRSSSGRRFVESRHEITRLTVFTFGPGQECFHAGDHRTPLEREPLYVVQGGDWRGNPRGIRARVHRTGEEWVDDFATHQINLAERIGRG